MLFQKEIHQINQLTKRFNRDCRKMFAQIQEDIKQAALTKDEVKTLIDSFGRINFLKLIIIAPDTYYFCRNSCQMRGYPPPLLL